MKKILSALTALLLLTLMMPLVYATDYDTYDYYIKDFRVEVTANSDRSYDVTETITVIFNEESRGIFRDIQTESSVERYRIGNINVVGDPYTVEEKSDYVRVRIGDPDVYITGEKTYTISYTRFHNDDGIPDYDYFYMDLIGDKWDVPIAHFSATVRLPEDADIHTYTITSGPTGSTGNEYAKGDETGNVIDVRMEKPLEPYMAVTLNVEMLPGAFGDAVVYTPPIEIHSINVKAELDEYGVIRVEERYDATVHAEQDLEHPIRPKKSYWVGPDGEQRDFNSYYTFLLDEYVGQRIQFSYIYEEENEITELESEYSLRLSMIGNSDVVSVHEYTVDFVSPLTLTNCVFQDSFRDRDFNAYTMSLTDNGRQLHIEAEAQPMAEYASVAFFVSGLKRRVTTADFIIPLIVAAVAGILFLFAFIVKPDKILVAPVEFYPPDKMNPAEIGYIIDGKISDRDITSLIYYWASCGNLSIEITDNAKSFTLHKISDLDGTHKHYEFDMFNKLFALGTNGTVTNKQLEEKFYLTVWSTAGHVKKYFTKVQPLEKFRGIPTLVSVIMMLGTALLFFALSQLWAYYYDEYITLWVFGVLLCPCVYGCLSAFRKNKHKKNAAKTASLIFAILFFAAFAICFIFTTIGQALSIVSTLLTLVAYAVCFFSVPHLRRKTELGIRLLERCIGFKTFLKTAEKTRLEMLLEETPEYYYNILPYAQVLGVSDIWEKKFDGLLSQPPSWYYGASVDQRMYSHNLNTMTDSLSSSMTSRPASGGGGGGRSSGGGGSFSGGGSSGGGGGGGGGRW